MQLNTPKTKSDQTAMTAMLLVALLIVLVFGALLLDTQTYQPAEYEHRLSYLSYQEGRLDSYDNAWEQGRNQGYLETETLAEYEGLIGQAESYGDGWQEGYGMGRDHGYYGYDYR